MGDTEEIVMTAAKRDSSAIMRLERMFNSEIDQNKVHHVCGGPYKGILINKAASDLDDVEPAEGRLEFLAYLVNEDNDNQALQDYWKLRFWFRGKADGIVKKKTFTDYFQELMNPSNFPKNYIGFIKKALVLLRAYPVIKRVELEVQQTHEPSPDDEESLPPIRSFTSVFTPAAYSYYFIPEVPINNKTFLTFMIKAAGDAHIALSAVYSDVDRKTVEIVIGTDGNTKSMIRDGAMGQLKSEAITMNVLNEKEFRYFWISWADHHIEVGRGAQYGYGRFLHWHIPPHRQFHINCLAVTTGKMSRGQWEFAELLDAEKDFGKEAKKNRVKHSLLWIAKKQRMLQCLEDAYPNTVYIADLLKQSKIKQSDMIPAVVMLKDLQKKGLMKEVEEGHWMRIQSGGEVVNDHEIKIVEDLPTLTGHEQPTIAIITSLYCEKLAVDAMIEDKTTYVKYKTEGDSQVYTIGRIGGFKVVSTKLAKIAGSTQAAKISAENTITRLLGTFSRVERVLLVGVGGAVPDYRDGSKHIRLGDVVVSLPSSRSKALYIQCKKVEKMMRADGYTYSLKEWYCKDQTLQNTASSLRDIIQCNPHVTRPWETFMEEAGESLNTEDSNFHRPSFKKDKLFYTNPDGTVVQIEHPTPEFGYREGHPNIRYGIIAGGKLVARTEHLRKSFAQQYAVRAFDGEFDGVFESLEGNRNESFLIIRGMADYQDGSKKEWQPYAALAAASYMKALITALP